jgi:hypothetical protein
MTYTVKPSLNRYYQMMVENFEKLDYPLAIVSKFLSIYKILIYTCNLF